ncbi:MAG: enoyl-CoA hydratase/isomerase family protein [Fimbriimonadaceae bacterium]|nr:enoyl-CoA hydratase/isomerase family protein [Fimbriimonadaceae bacterium]QYK55508.1 MAG: enoyl-CoA hydratase/isomerase family protein [Fimbriimonadaceae bacterium]
MVAQPQNVLVIGAGTMGSGIAAHLANLGFSVSLLDVSPDSVRHAFDRAKKARPPHFYVPGTAENVRLGSFEADLQWVGEADWVCEAIVEKLDAKRGLFALVEPLLREDAFISTNTSGLQIELLAEGRGESFRKRFLGTHFFNPPRYLKLLELIPTADTDPDVVRAMSVVLERDCARRVVLAKDTPGFIANRFGMWSMFLATHVAEKLGLSIEQVDLVTGPLIGRPRSGSFRLNDLVGLDVMDDIARNLIARCPDDPHTDVLHPPRSLAFLLEKGWIGEKVGQGYYRREGRELMSLDLTTLAYRVRQEPGISSVAALSKRPLAERLCEGLKLRDEAGEFLRAYLPRTLDYADSLKEEVSHNVEDFDRVMKWGFGWEAGPFEMMDMVDHRPQKFYVGGEMRGFDGSMKSRPEEPEYRTFKDYPVIEQREGFNVRDMGDGVTLIGITNKMGVFSPAVVRSLKSFLNDKTAQRIVLTSEQRAFSAGFDLQFILDAVNEGRYADVNAALVDLQQLGVLLSQVPSVAAVFGFCLGGGYEMATSCSIVAAHPETQIGLPEAKVGLVPGGGGVAMMRLRFQQSAKNLVEAARLLTLGVVATNADEARHLGYLREGDITVYNGDRLLTEAKRLALQAVAHPRQEWAAVAGPVSGMIDQMLDNLQKAGEISEHDHNIGDRAKHVLVKSTSFENALDNERKAFDELLKEGLTVARIKHMLDTGKPLRN